jgi:predicted nucleotidyltransferase
MLLKQEQLIRKVSLFGNGAHIIVPREWVNENILIVRIEDKPIKQKILELLTPNLDKVIGVFIYGSHARGESSVNSDIDVLVVARETFNFEKNSGIDLIILPEKDIKNSIKSNPILLYSIFREAKPVINNNYLENLRKIKLNKNYFKPFLNQTADAIKSNEDLLELDKQTGNFASNAVIYSLILRLRGLLIINYILHNKDFSNLKFSKWLQSYNINYNSVYEVYRNVRDDKKEKDSVPLEQADILLNLLKHKLLEVKNMLR